MWSTEFAAPQRAARLEKSVSGRDPNGGCPEVEWIAEKNDIDRAWCIADSTRLKCSLYDCTSLRRPSEFRLRFRYICMRIWFVTTYVRHQSTFLRFYFVLFLFFYTDIFFSPLVSHRRSRITRVFYNNMLSCLPNTRTHIYNKRHADTCNTLFDFCSFVADLSFFSYFFVVFQ